MTPEEIAREAAEALVSHLKGRPWRDGGAVVIGTNKISTPQAEEVAHTVCRDIAAAVLAAIERALRECPVPGGLTDERLAEIAERAEEATPGPWAADRLYYVDAVDAAGRRRERGQRVAGDAYPRVARVDCPADAKFVADARADVPALLAHVEHLTRALHDCGQDGTARVWAAGYEAGVRAGKEE